MIQLSVSQRKAKNRGPLSMGFKGKPTRTPPPAAAREKLTTSCAGGHVLDIRGPALRRFRRFRRFRFPLSAFRWLGTEACPNVEKPPWGPKRNHFGSPLEKHPFGHTPSIKWTVSVGTSPVESRPYPARTPRSARRRRTPCAPRVFFFFVSR